MFDIGFLELLVIAIIALVVIGPERLPSTVRTFAIWISRVKRTLMDARTEFEQQIGADEIRRQIHNEQVMKSLQKLKQHRDDIEQQIRNAAASDEEKYEDVHLLSGHGEGSASAAQSPSAPQPDDKPVANSGVPTVEKSSATSSTTSTATSQPSDDRSAQDSNSNK